MKRRNFGLLAGTSLATLTGFTLEGTNQAQASADPSLLTTTLTPFGGERAGNADGSIPAWTGGYTTIPAGFKSGDYIPELWPDEKPLLTIDSSNVAEHADMLNPGTVEMMKKYGFKIEVFPTHRTAAAPQAVYDRVAANAASATLDPKGPQYGFDNAFGGIPFPIPDTSNPLAAGAQIIWNQNAIWRGYAVTSKYESWTVNSGHPQLAEANWNYEIYIYYQVNSLAELKHYQGLLFKEEDVYVAPQNLVGQSIIVWAYTQPYEYPQAAWELLNGQGRVRRAPEISFDTPSSQANGIVNYDEYYGFNGSLERYNWKYLGKKEMYIPYNNNKLYGEHGADALLPHFIDPALVRWEKHRCWLVEATLAPGERNVAARRMFWIDEDTYQTACIDSYDASGNLAKVIHTYNNVRPDVPGTLYGNCAIHNLQTDDYAVPAGVFNQKTVPNGIVFADKLPLGEFDPANMAASAQY